MPDNFDFEKYTRPHKINLKDKVQNIPFQITLLMSNFSALVGTVMGDSFNGLIYREMPEIQRISTELTAFITVVAISGMVSAILTWPNPTNKKNQ